MLQAETSTKIQTERTLPYNPHARSITHRSPRGSVFRVTFFVTFQSFFVSLSTLPGARSSLACLQTRVGLTAVESFHGTLPIRDLRTSPPRWATAEMGSLKQGQGRGICHIRSWGRPRLQKGKRGQQLASTTQRSRSLRQCDG